MTPNTQSVDEFWLLLKCIVFIFNDLSNVSQFKNDSLWAGFFPRVKASFTAILIKITKCGNSWLSTHIRRAVNFYMVVKSLCEIPTLMLNKKVKFPNYAVLSISDICALQQVENLLDTATKLTFTQNN